MKKSMVTKKIYATIVVSSLLLNQKVYIANAVVKEQEEIENPILNEVSDDIHGEKNEEVQNNDIVTEDKSNNLNNEVIDNSNIVEIKDEKLLKLINYNLGKGEASTPITIDEIKKVTKLVVLNSGVESLEGLQYAANLEELYIENESTIATKANIDIISSISSLTKLRLVNCRIDDNVDLKTLGNLKKLTHLSLLDNEIKNIDFLSDFKNLSVLLLGGNKIEDISPLNELSNLLQLDLYDNDISDLTSLSKITSLKGLGLSKNKISNIEALTNLSNLEWLVLDNNNISDISALKDLNISYLQVLNQEINLDKKTIKEGTFTLKSPIRDKFGNTVQINDVLSLGVNKEDSITWSNILPGDNKFTMNFQAIKAEESKPYFTGTVYQYVDYIKENSAPIITASDKTIYIGDKFDALVGVKANDEEDGDLTDKIKIIENNVDTSKEGTYKVVYEVSDKEGYIITEEIKVTVNKKVVQTTTKPTTTKPTTSKKPVSKLPNTGGGTPIGLIGTIITSIGFILTRKNKR